MFSVHCAKSINRSARSDKAPFARAQLLLITTAVLLLSIYGGVSGQTAPSPSNVLRLDACYVLLIHQANVAAQEAGELLTVKVREGDAVKRGDIIATIDDSQPQLAKESAMLAQQVAAERAGSDVDERFANESFLYASADYRKSQLANERESNTVTQIDLLRLRLAQKKAELQIEQAQRDRSVAAKEAAQKGTEVKIAENQIRLRQIRAPLDGVVISVAPHPGEWVKPGDPVAHVVRMDQLRVKGHVDPSQFDQSEIAGREVTVEATLARGRRIEFSGRIVHVNPIVEALGYEIVAEVDNRKQNGHWLLLPGSRVAMTVHLDRLPSVESRDQEAQASSQSNP